MPGLRVKSGGEGLGREDTAERVSYRLKEMEEGLLRQEGEVSQMVTVATELSKGLFGKSVDSEMSEMSYLLKREVAEFSQKMEG